MSTIRKVAKEADVSVATVSRVFNNTAVVNEDLRTRVLEVASRLGYGTTRRPSLNYIALLYTGRASLASPYDVAVLDGMATAADENGFDLAIVRLQADRLSGESAVQMIHRKGLRGAVIRTTADSRDLCVELSKGQIPCIVVGDRFDDEAVNYVCSESRTSSYQAVEHLIALGHRRIAIAISHVPDRDHTERLAGYQEALKDHGIEFDPKLIQRVWALRPQGAQVVRNLMSMVDRPTAIFICDPLVAAGAINQAHEMGLKIPQDVSIVGFDDDDLRSFIYPKMTAVCQNSRLLGHEAMTLLTQRILRDPTSAIHKEVPTWLELHKTTGQPPAERLRMLPDGSRIIDDMPLSDRSH
jgi:DNA-binding LacI/PurR family transcriptional regulator